MQGKQTSSSRSHRADLLTGRGGNPASHRLATHTNGSFARPWPRWTRQLVPLHSEHGENLLCFGRKLKKKHLQSTHFFSGNCSLQKLTPLKAACRSEEATAQQTSEPIKIHKLTTVQKHSFLTPLSWEGCRLWRLCFLWNNFSHATTVEINHKLYPDDHGNAMESSGGLISEMGALLVLFS